MEDNDAIEALAAITGMSVEEVKTGLADLQTFQDRVNKTIDDYEQSTGKPFIEYEGE